MPQTTQCPNCGVVLNLPDNAAGKRLKCPKCGTRFGAGGSAGPRSDSNAAESPRPSSSPTSSMLLTTQASEPGLPTAEGDLRETFTPDLLLGEATSTKGEPGGRTGPTEASAAGLFQEPSGPRRKPRGAEARAQARRCPTCGSVVPAGMSLCARCGLDLDTGQRHLVDELFEAPPPPPRRAGPPLAHSIIGGATLLGSLILALLALVRSQQAPDSRWGFLGLALIALFGVYASVEFLRGRALRPLIAALLLGGVVDVVGLIALPVYEANRPQAIGEVEVDDEGMPQFRSVAERMEEQMPRIKVGIVLLVIDSALIAGLLTGNVRKHFEKSRASVPLPIP